MPKGTPNAEPFCSFPDCGKPNRSKGLCAGHDAQLRKGKPLTPLKAPLPTPTQPRECLTCHKVKEVSEFYVRSDGLPDRHCKVCVGEALKPGAAKRRREAGMKERWKIIVTLVDGVEGQECSWCREWKPLIDYYLFTPEKGEPYPMARCKPCVKDEAKVRHRTTADPYRQRPLGMGENRELSRVRLIRFQEAGKAAKSRREAVERDPERFRNYSAARRALVANAPVNDLTAEQWRIIVKVQEGRCFYCHRLQPLTLDHVIPLSRGGSHTASNVVGACQRCNSQKRAKMLDEWEGPRPA